MSATSSAKPRLDNLDKHLLSLEDLTIVGEIADIP